MITGLRNDGYVKIEPSVVVDDAVFIYASPSHEHVKRADFVAAVEALGYVVIDRANLPRVDTEGRTDFFRVGDNTWTGALSAGLTAEGLRSKALEYLALAEHLDTHPSVDEKQVEALADLLRAADREGPDTLDAGEPEHFARRLVEKGVRVEGAK